MSTAILLFPMPKVTYRYGDQVHVVEGAPGETLLQIGLDNGMPIEHACGGNGFCTTCMCSISEGMKHVEARTDREENMGVIDDPERLTCQARLKEQGDITVIIPE